MSPVCIVEMRKGEGGLSLVILLEATKNEVSKPYLQVSPYCSYIFMHILHLKAGGEKSSIPGCREKFPASKTCMEERIHGGKTTYKGLSAF